MAGHHLLHEPLDIRLEERGDKAVVLVAGACDASSHQQVREHLLAAEMTGARRIVVDLTALQFIDSIGLRVLIGAWRRARLAGHTFAVALATSGQVRRVFELTGVDQVVPMTEPHPA